MVVEQALAKAAEANDECLAHKQDMQVLEKKLAERTAAIIHREKAVFAKEEVRALVIIMLQSRHCKPSMI